PCRWPASSHPVGTFSRFGSGKATASIPAMRSWPSTWRLEPAEDADLVTRATLSSPLRPRAFVYRKDEKEFLPRRIANDRSRERATRQRERSPHSRGHIDLAPRPIQGRTQMSWFTKWFGRDARRKREVRPQFRPRLESLEDRVVLNVSTAFDAVTGERVVFAVYDNNALYRYDSTGAHILAQGVLRVHGYQDRLGHV